MEYLSERVNKKSDPRNPKGSGIRSEGWEKAKLDRWSKQTFYHTGIRLFTNGL